MDENTYRPGWLFMTAYSTTYSPAFQYYFVVVIEFYVILNLDDIAYYIGNDLLLILFVWVDRNTSFHT